MVMELRDLARNALGCLDLRGTEARGQELYIVYEGSNQFKEQLAQAMAEEARQLSVRTELVDFDLFLNADADDDRVIDELGHCLLYDSNDPLRKNAVNMVAPVGRYDDVRRRVTKGLLEKQVYILQFPFVHQETGEAMLSIDPKKAEEIALRIKADLDNKVMRYRIESGEGHVMEWPVNQGLSWVASVGMIKKYSPRPDGKPIGGWGNPGCETFTSFAVTDEDHEPINGSLYIDAFAGGRVLRDDEAFVVPVVRGLHLLLRKK